MLDYKNCIYCGSCISPGEHCACVNSMYTRLTEDKKGMVRLFVAELLGRQITETNLHSVQEQEQTHT